MELKRYRNPADFYDQVRDYLLRREGHHHLMLGILAALMARQATPREPAGDPDPYFALCAEGGAVVAAALMTPPHNVVVSLARDPSAFQLFARDLVRGAWPVPGVLGPAEESRAFAEAWQQATGQLVSLGMGQRIYQVERVVPVTGVPGELRRAMEADRDLLIRWVAAFGEEAGGDNPSAKAIVNARLGSPHGDIYLWWDGGQPTSLAGYTGPTLNGIRIGPVYTPPEFRRRGYASACVAALSQRLLDGGRRSCFLFTDRANPTSNHVYQRIGYQPVCDVDEYRFGRDA